MLALKMNYQDDDFEGKRKYSEIINDDGTRSYTDETDYRALGDEYGANDINKTNAALMGFIGCQTLVSADGRTITETDSYGNYKITSFSEDGKTITEELYDADGSVKATKTTSFSADGRTITEEAEIQ